MTNSFPTIRPRRLRHSQALRRMVQETTVTPSDLIFPLFVQHGEDVRSPIASMPGQFRLSIDQLSGEANDLAALGIPAVLLFGIPETKDPVGLENYAEDGIVQQAIRALKDTDPDLLVITDVCLCEYTDHGHCGILNAGDSGLRYPALDEGYVLNDETLDVLSKVAISHAESGADIVAPSGMMDGMVAAIRRGLDSEGYSHIPIMSYAVKYASAFYGPFRDAADGAPAFGDRKTHQMNPANAYESLREAALDIAEGADFLMVKPALPYLDVIRLVKDRYPEMPMAAYNVSGEYAMIKAASANGWLDEARVVLETLIGIKRAGADLILTYHAKDAVRWMEET